MTVFPEVLARAGRPARPLGVPPLHLLAGEPRHGVTRVAGELARATGAPTSTELTLRGRPEAVHLHVTDRVLARRPAQAAELVERLARRTRLTLTAHDVPQPSDGRAFAERRVAYERMLSAAHAWVTSSEHERRLVAEHCDTSPGAVIPLPLILPDVQPPARTVVAGPTIGLFGHVYPGKGHREAVEAAAGLRERGRTVTVLVIGGPGPGHQPEVARLRAHAGSLGVPLVVTGYLPDDQAAATLRGASVGLTGHRNLSASGSINSWVAAGRRPLVRDSRYVRELERLRPGSHLVYRDEDLTTRLEHALADPTSTWRAPGAPPGPDLAAVAARYREWWVSTR